jgi:hypothetical protein
MTLYNRIKCNPRDKKIVPRTIMIGKTSKVRNSGNSETFYCVLSSFKANWLFYPFEAFQLECSKIDISKKSRLLKE